MAQYGSVVANVVTSAAGVPVEGAALTITQQEPGGGTRLLAVLMSDADGNTEPFFIETPPESSSQQYQQSHTPYITVDLRIDRFGFDRIVVQGVQIFANTETLQPLMLIPTPTLPDSYMRTKTFVIPAQTLE